MKYGDTSGLLPFRKPTVPGDLNEGFPDNYISKPNDDHAAVELVSLVQCIFYSCLHFRVASANLELSLPPAF